MPDLAMTLLVEVDGDPPTPKRLEEYICAGIKSSEGKEPWKVREIHIFHSNSGEIVCTLRETWDDLKRAESVLNTLKETGCPCANLHQEQK